MQSQPLPCADLEKNNRMGVRTRQKNHKAVGFLNNNCPDPVENHKAIKLAINVGPSCFKWNLGPFSPSSTYENKAKKKTKKNVTFGKRNKNVARVGPL